MELKHYLSILKRHWVPVVAVPILVALVVIAQVVSADTTYTASAQLTVTRAPQQEGIEDFRYNEYYLFLASEFLVDDLVEIVHGNVFAEDVSERLREDEGINASAGEVQAAISADRQHRVLTLNVNSPDPDRALMIARTASRQLNENATQYFGFDTPERGAVINTIQIPDGAAPSQMQDQIFWALQILVGLFAGVLLAFFFDYMDDRLYTAEMVEHSLGVDVIAEVPRGKVS